MSSDLVKRLRERGQQLFGLCAEAADRIEALEEAITFYEERGNWRSPSQGFALQVDREPSPVEKDRGTIARKALGKCVCVIEMATFRYKGDPCPHCGDTIG